MKSETDIDFGSVIELLAKARSESIRLIYQDNQIVVRVPNGQMVSRETLAELKANKEALIIYFQHIYPKTNASVNESMTGIEVNGSEYFRVSSNEQYWLDPATDAEYKAAEPEHGIVHIAQELEGSVEMDILVNAFKSVILRHESLRSSFDKFDGAYLMKVDNGSSMYDCIEVRYADEVDEIEFRDYINFESRHMDLARGPLFIVRLLRLSDMRTVVAIQAHHIIMDSWSAGVLMRDLVLAYSALLRGQVPLFECSNLQLRHFTYHAYNEQTKNIDRDRTYLRDAMMIVPEKVLIPGRRNVPSEIWERKCEGHRMSLPHEIFTWVSVMAGNHSTTRFVILEAALRRYFLLDFGARDFLIGTYVHGRDTVGSEHQIGCFAKTILLRTPVSAQDSFQDVIRKVRSSHAAMTKHETFTLLDKVREMPPKGRTLYGDLWQVNVLYTEEPVSGRERSTVEADIGVCFKPLSGRSTSIIAIDLQWEFICSNATIDLLVSYDSTQYDQPTIQKLITGFTESVLEISSSTKVL